MNVKYCSVEHPAATFNLKNTSNIWKRMLSVRLFAEPHIKWLVGKWEIDASKDHRYTYNILSLPKVVQLTFLFNLDGTSIATWVQILYLKFIANVLSLLIIWKFATGISLALVHLICHLLGNWIWDKATLALWLLNIVGINISH